MASIVRGGSQICFEVIMEGYFLVVDILGFGEIVKNTRDEDLPERINEWVSLVTDLCNEFNIDRYQLISDTLFIGAGNKPEELYNLAAFSKKLLEKTIWKSLPIRGALSFGPYEWTNSLVYGKAVIDAHNHEMNQQWVGISLTRKLTEDINYLVVDFLVKHELCLAYAPPVKKGSSDFCITINWDVPQTDELGSLMVDRGLVGKGEMTKTVKSEFIQKTNNTILFALYNKITLEMGMDRSKFHGAATPVDVISSAVDEFLEKQKNIKS